MKPIILYTPKNFNRKYETGGLSSRSTKELTHLIDH